MKTFLKFKKPLIEGLIIDRPNRFTFLVWVENKIQRCHCPVTSRIADLQYKNIPCLLSKHDDNWTRNTLYDVEAISVDDKKTWIGINQTKANYFVDYFLRVGCFKEMLGDINSLQSEVPYKDAIIDFKVNGFFLEVKSPLGTIDWPMSDKLLHREYKDKVWSQRFDKHIRDLQESLIENKRAILLVCFQYERPDFKLKSDTIHLNYVSENFKQAIKSGVEIWQCDMSFNKDGITFEKCFNLTDYYKNN